MHSCSANPFFFFFQTKNADSLCNESLFPLHLLLLLALVLEKCQTGEKMGEGGDRLIRLQNANLFIFLTAAAAWR
jgi:hypothetical protein